MKDYKIKMRDLHTSHTLGYAGDWNITRIWVERDSIDDLATGFSVSLGVVRKNHRSQNATTTRDQNLNRRGSRVSVLGRESRSVIHAETKINSCVRVDVRFN
jgi:hypothetical protein